LFFVLLLPAAWLVFGHGHALGTTARLTLVLSAIGGLLAIRNVVWFALIAAAVLPRALDAAWAPRTVQRNRKVNVALVVAAVIGLSVTAATASAHPSSWFERNFPRKAGDAVAAAAAADPTMKVFANERYADWLLLEHPRLSGRIAYDIRFELLTQRQLEGVYDFVYQRGTHWRRAAAGYGLLVLDSAHERDVIDSYERHSGARPVYRDEHVVVLKVNQNAAT
jgi:hypothetical protein